MSDVREDNVIPFPGAPEEGKAKTPSAVERASLQEAADKRALDDVLRVRFEGKQLLTWPDRFRLARNLHDWLASLEGNGKLDQNELAGEIFGEPRRQKLFPYTVPPRFDSADALLESNPKRELVGKPARYHRILLAAARLAGVEEREARISLARGTALYPGAGDVADEKRHAAHQVVEVLERIVPMLDAVFPMARYFDLSEDNEILPVEREGVLTFATVDEFRWWDHEAIPAVRLAARWIERREIELAISSIPAGSAVSSFHFERLASAGEIGSAFLNRRRDMSLGIARLGGSLRPVAVFTHELAVSPPSGAIVVRQPYGDALSPGWHRMVVDVGDGPRWAGLRLRELDPTPAQPDEEEWRYEGDAPPDVRVVPITADWLLGQTQGQWRVAMSTGSKVSFWRARTQYGVSRFGARDTLPAIVELALQGEGAMGGLAQDIRARYVELSGLMDDWVAREHSKVEARLAKAATRISDLASGESKKP